jgi:molybdopterin biosynthesis enzyme
MVEDVIGTINEANYLRAKLKDNSDVNMLKNQSDLATISAANCLIYLPEKSEKISKGESAEVILLHEEML